MIFYTFNVYCSAFSLYCSVYDSDKVIVFQAGAADEQAVDIFLCHQLGSIVWFY